jgi:hypothetical protein
LLLQDYGELTEAADLVESFRKYWDGCDTLADPVEARQQLIAKNIDRVLVYDDAVVAVILHGSFGIVLGENQTAPAGIADAGFEVLLNEGITVSSPSTSTSANPPGKLSGWS